MRFQTKIALVFSAVVTLLFAVTGAMVLKGASDRVGRGLGRKLQAIAIATAEAVDGEDHRRITDHKDADGKAFKRVREKLQTVQKRLGPEQVRYLYTLYKAPDGEFRFVVDADDSAQAKFGTPFPVRSAPELVRDYPAPTYETFPRQDRWGLLMTGYAPILGRDGQPVGAVGVDASLEMLRALQKVVLRNLGIGLVFGVLLSIPASFAAGWLLAAPVQKLIHAAEAVGAGDLETKVDLPGDDDLARLGKAFNAMTAGLKERDFVKQMIQKYVSRDVADKVMAMPLDALAGERRRVSVLFTDLRRFMRKAESMPPEQVLSALNAHFAMLTEVLLETEGELDKFYGDGVMAVFGAPISNPDDALRAVRAAMAIQRRSRELNERRAAQDLPTIPIAIGVHTGSAVAGNVGGDGRKEYWVVGETACVAARIQGSVADGEVVISDGTLNFVRDKVKVEPLAPKPLKDKSELVMLYRVESVEEPAAKSA